MCASLLPVFCRSCGGSLLLVTLASLLVLLLLLLLLLPLFLLLLLLLLLLLHLLVCGFVNKKRSHHLCSISRDATVQSNQRWQLQ